MDREAPGIVLLCRYSILPKSRCPTCSRCRCNLIQNEDGLDYEDAIAVQASIGDTWWLTSLSCKYMLCCFVHKDCKDLSTRPTELPSGHTRKEARVNSRAVLAKEREESKAERFVGGDEQYGDVKHQLKKARVVGMQAQAEKISIETIQTKLKLLRENADVYKLMHGEELYNKMVVDLINKMTGSTSNGIGETPVSAVSAQSSQRDEDFEDDDGAAEE